MRFTDYYGEQSCTAGRAAFITGQNPYRTGFADGGQRIEDTGPLTKLLVNHDDAAREFSYVSAAGTFTEAEPITGGARAWAGR